MITHPGRVETIEMRRHWDAGRDGGWVEVLKAPPLSAISTELLNALGDEWRDPDAKDVLVFAPGIRYLVGEHHQRTGTYLLHRLP